MTWQTTLRSTLVGASLFVASWAALAQPAPSASHVAAARELMDLTGALTSVDEMLPGFAAEIRKQTVTRPDLTKDLDEVIKTLQPEMQQQRNQAYDSAARIYAKYLTEPELREVIAFFKTPTGSKYIKVQPQLIDEIVDSFQIWAQHTAEYVQSRVRSEMAKRGHAMQ